MKKNTYAIRRKRVTADVKIPIGIKTTLNDLLRFHPRTCRVDHFICQLYPGHPYTVFPGNEIMKTEPNDKFSMVNIVLVSDRLEKLASAHL